MKELFDRWLDSRLTVPGMVACGIAAADAGEMCRCSDEGFTSGQMAQILRLLQTTPAIPDTDPAALKWRTWLFDNGKIRSAIRPDGWILAVAVRTNSDAAQILDPLTEEFLALKPAADAAKV